MKKVILSIIVSLLLISAISIDVSAAKKSSKLSKEEIAEMSDTIDNLTKKIYGRALLSPKDNEDLIGIKIKLDNQMLMASNPELAPLYYKAGNIYRLREMKPEAIECYQTVLENFSETALAPKARTALEQMGVEIAQPTNTEEETESDDGI
jgi:hypothetical protein